MKSNRKWNISSWNASTKSPTQPPYQFPTAASEKPLNHVRMRGKKNNCSHFPHCKKLIFTKLSIFFRISNAMAVRSRAGVPFRAFRTSSNASNVCLPMKRLTNSILSILVKSLAETRSNAQFLPKSSRLLLTSETLSHSHFRRYARHTHGTQRKTLKNFDGKIHLKSIFSSGIAFRTRFLHV